MPKNKPTMDTWETERCIEHVDEQRQHNQDERRPPSLLWHGHQLFALPVKQRHDNEWHQESMPVVL
jgi:hypothetical protein